jgi:diguanylate cyclase (GGDEF)-like protein
LDAIDELVTNAILVVDHEGIIRRINKGVTAILGYNENDLIGNRIETLLPGNIKEFHKARFSNYTGRRQMEIASKSKLIGVQRTFPDTVVADDNEPKRFALIHKNQHEIPINLTVNEIWSGSDDLIGFVAIISDNTMQYTLQQQLQHQTAYDQLVGLMSWQGFEKEVMTTKQNMLENGEDYHASLLFLDVDYFNTITYGSQKAGDRALKMVATWLLDHSRQKSNRARDIITSRFLGDQFIVYLPGASTDGALVFSKRVKEEFTKLNLRTVEEPFFTTISIGITKITQDTKLYNAASQASQACHLAKRKGRNKIEVVFDDGSDSLKMERTIRDALKNQRLKLHAQKIVPISASAKTIDNDRAHYEVLSRMEDKQGNNLSPVVFIPAAESLGLAMAIDKYVVEHTIAALRNDPDHVESLSLCSINLSGMSVSSEGMYDFIEQQIRLSGIDPGKFCFEVTETAEIMDKEVALALVSNLRNLGCKSAFDDFGIGYSNYQSFSRLPVDIIKIDGSYVRKILENRQLKTDMEGMINSAKARGVEIVGEFAENAEIVAELERLGVDYAQGYYFSKPVPLEVLMGKAP